MTDLSSQRTDKSSVGTLLAGSFGTYLHLVHLLWQAWWREGDRTREAVLTDGSHVPLHQLFDLDGTTLCVPRADGTIRRIPASQVVSIIDKGDHGFV